jgi:tRNA G18 (ribose-2'-O)-methylase SpoU
MRKLTNSELNRINVNEYKNSEKTPIIVVLDNVRSLNNIGSVFRTSDAFLVERIYLCGITATPPHRDIQKTALGATESVDWKYCENTLDAIHEIKAANYKIISIEQVAGSISLEQFEVVNNQKYAVIFGNEVKGVQQALIDMSDNCIEIPQFGTKHSFNISVSAGIVLWELYKKLKL